MNVTCQCGLTTFRTPTPEPVALYLCHCSICRHQSGSAFGTSAMFPRFRLPTEVLSTISKWSRPTASGTGMHCYFCRQCGTRLMHERDGKDLVSIKGGCIDKGLDWGKAVHIWAKEAVVPIPEGAERVEEEPED